MIKNFLDFSKNVFKEEINPASKYKNKNTFIFAYFIIALILTSCSILIYNKKLPIEGIYYIFILALWASFFKVCKYYNSSIDDKDSLTLGPVILFNIFNLIWIFWFIIGMLLYVVVQFFILLFPIALDAIYLYALHLLVISSYYYLKSENVIMLEKIKNVFILIFNIFLYLLTGLNLPFISLYSAAKNKAKYGV